MRERDRRRAHDASSQIPMAVSSAAKPYVSVLVRTRCCQAVPARAPDRCRKPDEHRVADLDLAAERKDDHPRAGGDGDREQGGRRRRPLRHPRDEDQQRHGDDAPSDPEEGGEDPRREPDGDEAHGTYRTSMVSRVGLLAILLAAGIAVSGAAARTPPTGTAMFLVEHDPRLCPSPLCGGYWVSLANGVRTRCGNGQPQTRCYAARAVDRYGRPYADEIPGGLARAWRDRARRDVRRPHARPVPRVRRLRAGRHSRRQRRLLPRRR